jgi:hypothetical protein
MIQGDQLASPGRPRKANLSLAAGVFLAVLGIYVLANPGRIDIIDGQARYDVAMNWLQMGRPILWDPAIANWGGVRGRGGLTYSYFGPLGSLAAVPLVWVGTLYDDPPGEATRFLFAQTTSVFGALAAAILFLFYIKLGVEVKKAVAWTGVAAFATLLWSASETTNDNAQHACLVLAAVFLGFLSSERRSPYMAMLGGLVAGLLFTYQEYFALIIPLLGLSTLDEVEWGGKDHTGGAGVFLRPFWLLLKLDAPAALREFKSPTGLSPEDTRAFHRACWRYGLFLLASLVGVALALDFNYLRFGSLFATGKLGSGGHRHLALFGNPLAGALTLAVSPGKSILLYCPPIILGFAGIRQLWRHKPQMGITIVASSIVLALFLSTFKFAGGAWCWGPRYLVPLVPLWALAFPFAPIRGKHWKNLALGIVAAGFIVQLLGVSVEDQRYFFERGIADHYWANDSWFEFKHSQLLARPGEVLSLIKDPPREAVLFNTDGMPPTYTSLRPPHAGPPSLAPGWVRYYRVFYVPKPWAIWMWDIPPDQRALNLPACVAGIMGVALLGLALIQRGLQHEF